MTYREAAGRLRRLGCRELERRAGGSHRKWINPTANRAAVLPDWGSKDLKPGTLRAVVNQLEIDWSEFEKA
ncbi:MAG: type II toxin-antitoxin system HicA family toxin [Chloroflexota bacterium]|nr:type II toxin-antitoxin system HicA family toxin [Chloroflexota bacterium]